MKDYLTFSLKQSEQGKKLLSECKDSTEASGRSLLVKLEATHSGIVNSNFRFYRPDRMQASVHQWVEANKPFKPVLVEHDKKGATVGRILSARYLDSSHEYRDEVPELGNTLFYADSATKKIDLFKSVNLVLDKLMPLADYRGLGYIELGAKITDPSAIRKVLDEEFLTVSVGFSTDQAICSACHTDWAADDKCEHKLGEMVDGKRMFLIVGNFFYKECSFVNFAADPFAQVISKEILKDSVDNKSFFLGLPSVRQSEIATACGMTDSIDLSNIYESDISVVHNTDLKDSDMLADLQSFLDEMNKAPLSKERSTEVLDKINALAPVEDNEKELKRRVLSTLKSHIQKHNLGTEANKELTKDAVEAKIETLIPTLTDLSVDGRLVYLATITEEAKQFGLEVPAIDVVSLSISKDKKEAVAVADSVKTLLDALHSRKEYTFDDAKIPSDTLACMDSLNGHYMAADEQGKNAMGYGLYAHISNWHAAAEKDFAVTRVKKLEEQKDELDPSLTDEEKKASLMVVGAGLRSEQGKGFVPSGAVDSFQALHKAHVAADSDGKSHISSAAGALLEHWKSGSMLEYHRALIAPGTGQAVKDNEIVLTKEEHDTLMTGQDRLESQVVALRTERDAMATQNIILVKSLKKDRATALIAIKVLTGEAGFQGLTTDQINEKVAEKSARNLDSLKDSLIDELSKLDDFTYQGEHVTISSEKDKKEISDSATITTPPEVTIVEDSTTVTSTRKLPRDPKARRAAILFDQKIALLDGKVN